MLIANLLLPRRAIARCSCSYKLPTTSNCAFRPRRYLRIPTTSHSQPSIATTRAYYHALPPSPPPPPPPPPTAHEQYRAFETRPPPPPNYQSPFPAAADGIDDGIGVGIGIGTGKGTDAGRGGGGQRRDESRRLSILALCAVGGMVSLYVVATNFAPPPSHRLDSARPGWGRGAEILLAEEHPGGLADIGTTKVPGFPRRLWIPKHAPRDAAGLMGPGAGVGDEYVLVGHGIRTVSFLRIQVYVVGLYVHIDDLPVVEQRLQRPPPPLAAQGTPTPPPSVAAAALALTLPVRSVLRIVPVRNTDWAHLRDGFVRAILSHQPQPQPQPQPTTTNSDNSNEEEDFAHALSVFKGLFHPSNALPRSVPAGASLYLVRGSAGELHILYEPTAAKGDLTAIHGSVPTGVSSLPPPPPATSTGTADTAHGVVRDARISAALWDGYFGGGKVASEQLRDRVWKRLEALGRGEGTREQASVN